MDRAALDRARSAIVRILDDAHDPLPAREFLGQAVAAGHSVDVVVAAVQQMLDRDEVRFNADMHLRLARQLA
jgi:hypothetical protein